MKQEQDASLRDSCDTGHTELQQSPILLKRLALLYVLVSPFETLTLPVVGTPATVVGTLLILFWLLDLLASRRRPLVPPAAVVIFLLLGMWTALSTSWSWDPDASITGTISYLGLALGALAICDLLYDEVMKASWALLAGTLVFLAPLIMAGPDVAGGGRFVFAGIDANISAFHLSLGLAASLYILSQSRELVVRLSLIFAVLLLFSGVLLTGSRTGLGAAIVVLLVYVAFSTKSLGATAFAVVASVLLFLLFGTLRDNGFIPVRIVTWLESPTIVDFRQQFIDAALETQDRWRWVGVGQGADLTYLSQNANVFHNIHGAFYRIWLELGLVGLMLWGALLVVLFFYGRQPSVRGLMLLALPPFVAFMYTLGPLRSNVMWAFFGLALSGYASSVAARQRDESPEQMST